MKKLWLLALTVALAALYMPAFADEDSMEDMNSAIGSLTSKVNDLAKKGPTVEIHGFVQQDIINDSTESFNETVGNGAVKQSGSVAGDNGWTQMSLRNSRISLLTKADIGGWTTKGYIEADFLGYDPGPGYGALPSAPTAPSNNEYKFFTQPTLRLRHAYLDAQNDGWEILAGQWWSLFGWNMDYVLATVSEAPVMGTLYERTPQLRVQKTFGTEKDSMELQVAVDAEMPDQIASQSPNLDAGIRFIFNDLKGRFCGSTGAGKLQPLSLGLSLRNANYVWDNQTQVPGSAVAAGTGYNLNQNMWGSAVAVNALIPVLPAAEGKDDPSIVLTGEWTAGAGDTQAFNGGGFSGLNGYTSGTLVGGQSLNINGGIFGLNNLNQLVLVQLQSFNAQIQIFLPPSIGTIFTAGFGELYSPNDGGLGASYNDDRVMFVNVMQDFTPSIRVGLEYATFDTHYVAAFANNLNDAIDNRVQLSSWYRF